MGRLTDSFKAYMTGTASATAKDVRSGKVAFGQNGSMVGTGPYMPGGTYFDGVNADMWLSVLRNGNKLTCVFRGNFETFLNATETYRRIFQTTSSQPSLYVYPSDHGSNPNKGVFLVRNSSATAVCQLYSSVDMVGNGPASYLYAYDGDAGTAVWYRNGVSIDDVGNGGRILTTGTLNSSTQTNVLMGGQADSRNLEGDICFFGLSNAYITDYSLFFDSDNMPIYQDTTAWASTGWGAQPLIWNPHANLVKNLGSAGNFNQVDDCGGSWEDLYTGLFTNG